MSVFQIHTKLSAAIRHASKLQKEIANSRQNFAARTVAWIRFLRTRYQIRQLKSDLRTS